jgi:hypothetical protein
MNANDIVTMLRRVALLEPGVFKEIRDDDRLTPIVLGGLVAAVILAGLGAWMYGETVIDGYSFSFVDTVVLGSLFTLLLMFAGMGIVYLMMLQVFRIDIAPDALIRLLAVGHIPYVVGILVLVPEVGFAFGVFSVLAVFYWTLYALRAALPVAEEKQLMWAIVPGMAVWLAIIPLISEYGGDEFVTGAFVYGLLA